MTSTEHLDRPEFSLGKAQESISSVPSSTTVVIIKVGKDQEVSKSIGSISAISKVCSQIHGPVSISSIQIRWRPRTKGCDLKFVAYSSSSTRTSSDYGFMPNAGGEVSTEMRHGEWKTFQVQIPTGLAAQISPVSGQYPPASLFLSSKGDAECYVDFHLFVGGQRFIHAEDF